MTEISRRAVLTGSAAAAVTGGGARGAAPKALTQGPGFYRHRLGDTQLTALYDEVGFDTDKDTIALCRIGERSSLTWFVLTELLGPPDHPSVLAGRGGSRRAKPASARV